MWCKEKLGIRGYQYQHHNTRLTSCNFFLWSITASATISYLCSVFPNFLRKICLPIPFGNNLLLLHGCSSTQTESVETNKTKHKQSKFNTTRKVSKVFPPPTTYLSVTLPKRLAKISSRLERNFSFFILFLVPFVALVVGREEKFYRGTQPYPIAFFSYYT